MDKLTVGKRIIVRLSRFSKHQDDYSCPPGTTQEGLAASLGISKQHAGNELRKLMKKGLASMRSAHINGADRKMKAYFLTLAGEREADAVEDAFDAGEVTTPGGGSGLMDTQGTLPAGIEEGIELEPPPNPAPEHDGVAPSPPEP